jgi:hypothetical protein
MYGIHPWDVPRLSMAEINEYVQAVNAKAEQARRAEAEASRRR